MNFMEDEIIEKSLETRGNAAEIEKLFFYYVNNPNYCKGTFSKTLTGNGPSKVMVYCARIFDTFYFLSDFENREGHHFVQISSLVQYRVAHLVYSSYLRDLPLLTEYFNDLGITEEKVDIINYAEALAINTYKARNYFEQVILCIPKTSDWYHQRTLVGHVINDFLKHDDDCNKIDDKLIDLDGERIYCVIFKYKDIYYFWIDVLSGIDVHASHLETISNDEIRILFASEAYGRSFLPTDENLKKIVPLYFKLLETVK